MTKNLYIKFVLLVLLGFVKSYGQTPTPWNEGFATTTLPAGWTSTYYSLGSPAAVGGNPGNSINKYRLSAGTESLTSPEIGSISTSDYLSFEWKNANYAPAYAPVNASGYFKIFISTNGGTTYTQIDSIATSTISAWHKKAYALSSYSGQNIKFKIVTTWLNNVGWYIAFDNFSVGALNSCLPPTQLYTTVTQSGFTANWTNVLSTPSMGYEYYYSTSSVAPTSATPGTSTSANTAAISNLTPGTSYYVWVRSVCASNSKSAWEGPVSANLSYCIPVPNSISGTGIINVQAGTFSNPTGAEVGNYASYSNLSINSPVGATMTIVTTVANTISQFYHLKIWVDWNDDYDFDDTDEMVYSVASHPFSYPTDTIVSVFTVPTTAAAGSYRMRIGTTDDLNSMTIPTPCYNSWYGSYEDYSTNVTAACTEGFTLGNDTSICEGEGLLLTAGNAGAGTRYRWSTGDTTQNISVNSSGNYEVEMIHGNGCTHKESILVSAQPLPSSGGINVSNSQGQYNFSVLNPTNTLNYSWNFGDGSPSATGANVSHLYTQAGSYMVTLTQSNNCGSKEYTTTVAGPTGINKIDEHELLIHPNPANQLLEIQNKTNSNISQVQIFNFTGQSILAKHVNARNAQIKVGHLAQGIYQIKIIMENQEVEIRKVQIAH